MLGHEFEFKQAISFFLNSYTSLSIHLRNKNVFLSKKYNHNQKTFEADITNKSLKIEFSIKICFDKYANSYRQRRTRRRGLRPPLSVSRPPL